MIQDKVNQTLAIAAAGKKLQESNELQKQQMEESAIEKTAAVRESMELQQAKQNKLDAEGEKLGNEYAEISIKTGEENAEDLAKGALKAKQEQMPEDTYTIDYLQKFINKNQAGWDKARNKRLTALEANERAQASLKDEQDRLDLNEKYINMRLQALTKYQDIVKAKTGFDIREKLAELGGKNNGSK